jgi:hypothetical protein
MRISRIESTKTIDVQDDERKKEVLEILEHLMETVK